MPLIHFPIFLSDDLVHFVYLFIQLLFFLFLLQRLQEDLDPVAQKLELFLLYIESLITRRSALGSILRLVNGNFPLSRTIPCWIIFMVFASQTDELIAVGQGYSLIL